jgi:16S rRNA (cytosine967-C5)-methyltransferase
VTTSREVALACLERIDQQGAYANLVVPAALSSTKLSTRDRAFVTELVYGTTRMRRACDAVVDRFVLSEPEPAVRTLLRLGAYQLTCASVAPHAAVGETVALAPRRVRGFVNAVLRKVATTPMVWSDRPTELSYPDWLAQRLAAELGDEADVAMVAMNQAPPVTMRDDGYTQDRSSQWVAESVGAVHGESVLDISAAPGGKTTAIAGARGRPGPFVVAADLSPSRIGLLAGNVARLGSDAAVVRADGTSAPFRRASFDRVLLDAPCSGLGALRRRPDARWRITPDSIVELAGLQRRLLVSAADLVRPGGVLVYSVCTVTAEESIDHPVPSGFDIVDDAPVGRWRPYGRGWRVLPHDDDTDGMVMIRYRRRHD